MERTIGTNKELIIGIVVVQSVDQFSDPIKDRARSAGYNIILTDKNNLYSALTEFIDGSNNNGGVRNEVVRVATARIEGEVARKRMELSRRRSREAIAIW